ncbi:uncharacterized protein [Clytia hemisphaerica]|uniref:uncharacterized protein n=1 Tax=Clytia hemisphaerica TaxID=252671 RepID=UPI0034D3F212
MAHLWVRLFLGEPGVITEQWFTSENDCFAADSIIRYYIDNGTVPAIEGSLFLMHGIGWDNGAKAGPWGNKWVGQLAQNGGLYNTIRIPYGKSIRVTVTPPRSGVYWFILRGVENYGVVVGDLALPPTARLRLQKIENKQFDVYEYIDLARSIKENGLLFMVTLAANSTDFNYLEGCFRLCTRDHTDVQYLSSGTEDFFLSAFYYNKGVYHTQHAGLTYFQHPGTMSAYKIFASDPLIFKDSFHLLWRQSEKNDNECYTRTGAEECEFLPDGTATLRSTKQQIDLNVHKKYPTLNEKPMFAVTNISSYVWFYEW